MSADGHRPAREPEATGPTDLSEALTGRVLEMVAGVYRVELDGEDVSCVLRGRAKRGGHSVVAGDMVAVERLPDGTFRIDRRLPRRSRLARTTPSGRRQIIAANIDQVAVVVAVARPSPDLRMLDRLLVLAHLNGLSSLVVVNKSDLLEPPGEEAALDAFHPYREAGYPVVLTSAPTGRGLDELRTTLHGRVSVFAGASGVGKSSLLNALMPGLGLRIGAVGEKDGRGRHTTVSARLIRLADDGFLADTPGIQYIGVGAVSPRDLSGAFPEFGPYLAKCRFSDCRHAAEPDCAVRGAVEAGAISEDRFLSFRSLLEEDGVGG